MQALPPCPGLAQQETEGRLPRSQVQAQGLGTPPWLPNEGQVFNQVSSWLLGQRGGPGLEKQMQTQNRFSLACSVTTDTVWLRQAVLPCLCKQQRRPGLPSPYPFFCSLGKPFPQEAEPGDLKPGCVAITRITSSATQDQACWSCLPGASSPQTVLACAAFLPLTWA